MMGRYVITGATGGIGGAVAELLHDQGHQLVLVGSHAGRLEAAAQRLGGCEFLVLDLLDVEGITARGSLPAAGDSPVDGLVHSAGLADLGTIANSTAESWMSQYAVNVAGPAALTRCLLPALRTARGHVVFVNSGQGLHTNAGWGAYSASKHAARALAQALRAEEGPNGIRVTSVYPGRTATHMQQDIRRQEGAQYEAEAYIQPRSVARTVLAALMSPPDMEVADVSVIAPAG
ncbi:SDR family oxidoreductase [Micromonospora sp. WMMA1363]|uniref:SDR family oxidoreductase n=1 Tax=Micromonospora sp. WMMA1363 TaxID=3053985 RepID=UPI00259CFFE9|nr:SDR family oxidoreductase [Micromonospora sp. WMMA1363]MDM4722388.1 SDR family oxidoreductase [Micromonospora sp. WMMA1363]